MNLECQQNLELKIVEEKHYKLVPSSELNDKEIADYRT